MLSWQDEGGDRVNMRWLLRPLAPCFMAADGHPDCWNKLWVMTRGGVSKATRCAARSG